MKQAGTHTKPGARSAGVGENRASTWTALARPPAGTPRSAATSAHAQRKKGCLGKGRNQAMRDTTHLFKKNLVTHSFWWEIAEHPM